MIEEKEFIVIEYCCAEMGREMNEHGTWEITEDGNMSCWDGECAIGGKFCFNCGEKIEIQ